MNTFNEQYIDLARRILEQEPIKTRGSLVKELVLEKIVIDPSDNVITIPGVKTNIKYAQKELEWYRSGSNRIDFDPLIERTWRQFSDHGITVNSAYGYHLFSKELNDDGLTQWEWAKQNLIKDKNTRRATITINQPKHQQLSTKDFPCTMFLQMMIRDNKDAKSLTSHPKLDWFTFMRSQDLFKGTRNDVYCFTELQKQLSQELNVDLGKYYHVMTSCHLYETEWEKFKKI